MYIFIYLFYLLVFQLSIDLFFQYEITVLEEKLKQMKPNIAAIAEYRKKVF